MTAQKSWLASSLLAISGLAVALGGALSSGAIAHAQTFYTASNGTNYSVPAGYTAYNYGVYYNASTATYYDPLTGQYSMSAPAGPASVVRTYAVPSGYATYNYGVYYNASTATYYDPMTGQYSSTAPSGPASTGSTGAYVIPFGYSSSLYGTYYNASNGMYYDPATGFYSTSAPAGPSSVTSAYSIPSGYTASVYGTYYNASTGQYYDPTTGLTSTGAPSGPSYYSAPAASVTASNPGLPNTGAGGDASETLSLLAFAACLALAGIAFAGYHARSAAR